MSGEERVMREALVGALLRCLTCGASIVDPLAGCAECGAEDAFMGTQWLSAPSEWLPLAALPDAEVGASGEAALRKRLRSEIGTGGADEGLPHFHVADGKSGVYVERQAVLDLIDEVLG